MVKKADSADQEFNKRLIDGLQRMQTQLETENDKIFKKLKEYGIDLSEEKIIEDYKRFKDVQALDDYYYEQYGEALDRKNIPFFNSDVFIDLIDSIIPEHFDYEEIADPSLIENAANEILSTDLRSADQKEIEKLLRALIAYSKTRDHHSLEDISEYMDFSYLLKELIRVCHNRNSEFRNLIREMYECYDDMDPRILPSVYKEVQKNKK